MSDREKFAHGSGDFDNEDAGHVSRNFDSLASKHCQRVFGWHSHARNFEISTT